MEKIKNIFSRSEKEFDTKKAFLILLGIYCVALLPIIRADYNYIDDMGRVAYGYTGWEAPFSRYLSSFLSHFLHAGEFLSDISPLPQLLAAVVMAVSNILVLYILTEKRNYTIWEMIAVLPMGLSPYFLQCFSYKYDAPYMALSVLVSILPILFVNRKSWIYCVASALCTVAMCTTYQAASGIFPMLVVVLSFHAWNKQEKLQNIGGFIFKSALGYIIGMLTFRLLLMESAATYVSNRTASFKDIIRHYVIYFKLVYTDLKKIWLFLILLLCILFIARTVLESKQKKIFALVLGCSAILVMVMLAWGAYPVLADPLTAPRAMYGFGVFVSFVGLGCITGKGKKQYVSKVVSLTLSWCFLIFALTYGNSLAVQEEYVNSRLQVIVNDLNELEIMKTDTPKLLQIKGNVGLSPIIKRKPQNNKILNRMIPITLIENDYWGDYKLRNYYGIPGLKRDKTVDLMVMDLPKVKDTMYHNIYADKEHLLIEIK